LRARPRQAPRRADPGPAAGEDEDPGLCSGCRHGRRVPGARSIFWLCERWRSDPRFDRYPRLPVLTCPGYESARAVEGGRDPSPAG